MGQQQLLLLVLGIVIVGLAVVVGIQGFTENQKKSEIDNYTQLGVEMGAEIIAWYKKPTAMGGAGEIAGNLATLSVADLGYELDVTDTYDGKARTATEANAVRRHIVQNGTVPYLHIHEHPIQTGSVRVEVYVYGPYPECMVQRTDYYNESTAWSDGNDDSTAPGNPNATLCSW